MGIRKGLSYVQMTLKELRAMGRICDTTQSYNRHSGKSSDLFGIIDILCPCPGIGFVGVQVCGQDWTEHVTKMTEDKAQVCLDWLSTPGGMLELWGWRKVCMIKKDGRKGKAKVWRPRIADIVIENETIVLKERK